MIVANSWSASESVGVLLLLFSLFFLLLSFFLSLWYAKERPLKKNIANKFSLGLVGQKKGKGEFCLLMQLTFRISDLVITCLTNWATEHWVFLSMFGGEPGSRRCLNGTYCYQSKLLSFSFTFFFLGHRILRIVKNIYINISKVL